MPTRGGYSSIAADAPENPRKTARGNPRPENRQTTRARIANRNRPPKPTDRPKRRPETRATARRSERRRQRHDHADRGTPPKQTAREPRPADGNPRAKREEQGSQNGRVSSCRGNGPKPSAKQEPTTEKRPFLKSAPKYSAYTARGRILRNDRKRRLEHFNTF